MPRFPAVSLRMVSLRARLTTLGTLTTRGFWSIMRSMALFPRTILFVLGDRWTTWFPLIALSHLSAMQKRHLLTQSWPPCILVLQLWFMRLGARAMPLPIGLSVVLSVVLSMDLGVAILGGPLSRRSSRF